MPISITLTSDQLDNVISNSEAKVSMLTEEQVEAVATRLNNKINIPFTGEGREQKIARKIVRRVDQFLFNILPDEVYEMVNAAHDGIDKDEAEMIKVRVAKLINKHVNLPFLSEKKEKKILEFVLGMILDGLRQGKTVDGNN